MTLRVDFGDAPTAHTREAIDRRKKLVADEEQDSRDRSVVRGGPIRVLPGYAFMCRWFVNVPWLRGIDVVRM
jgi:hypothetical protein